MNNSFLGFKFLSVWVVSALLVSCGDRPSYVLGEDKMVSLMADMEIAEAYSNQQTGGRTTKQKIELGRSVLAAHGVTPEELDTTLAWYGRNLDEYSKLFEKVDKEILKRKERYVEKDFDTEKLADNIWPYSNHLILSPLSGQDALVISLGEPPVNGGEKLNLSFSLPNRTNMKGLLGVDYSDGTSESINSVFNGKAKVEMNLQIDTAKTVSRMFGVFSVKDKKDLPLYIDSLKITTLPFDTIEYRQKKRTQKNYGILLPKPRTIEIKDSILQDSIINNKADSLALKKPEVLGKDSIPPKRVLKNKRTESLQKRKN